jgi:hypothetical protein
MTIAGPACVARDVVAVIAQHDTLEHDAVTAETLAVPDTLRTGATSGSAPRALSAVSVDHRAMRRRRPESELSLAPAIDRIRPLRPTAMVDRSGKLLGPGHEPLMQDQITAVAERRAPFA